MALDLLGYCLYGKMRFDTLETRSLLYYYAVVNGLSSHSNIYTVNLTIESDLFLNNISII